MVLLQTEEMTKWHTQVPAKSQDERDGYKIVIKLNVKDWAR